MISYERRFSRTAVAFGFSHPSFYQAHFQQDGLPVLLPQRPDPKRAHKLGEAILLTFS